MVGCRGSEDAWAIETLAAESRTRSLGGLMVWFATVPGGFTFEPSWDASGREDSQRAFVEAMETFRNE